MIYIYISSADSRFILHATLENLNLSLSQEYVSDLGLLVPDITY